MGDRWTLNLRCDWCGEMNEDVWYAPSSDADSFNCGSCGLLNDIIQDFVARKNAPDISLKPSSKEKEG